MAPMTAGSADSIADALRHHAQPPAPREEEAFAAEIDDESGDVVGEVTQEPAFEAPPPTTRRAPTRRKNNNDGLKQVMAPVFITVGALMLVPALWALLHLLGITTSTKPNANLMAYVMLLCWPIALALIATGSVLVVQTIRRKS